MESALAIQDVHSPLGITVGWRVQEILELTQLWCERFFIMSDDRNDSIHSYMRGQGIVQPMALLTAIFTKVGTHVPGYQLRQLGQIKLVGEVRVNDQIILDIDCIAHQYGLMAFHVTAKMIPAGKILETDLCFTEHRG